jgi:hypothetical protein
LAATALAGGALAKGPPVVELSGTPHGTHPGETWSLTITVRGVAGGPPPTVTIANLGTGERRVHGATPTGREGEYAARVVFPEEGRYTYEVLEALTGHRYTFPPVRIVAAPPAEGRPGEAAPGPAVASAGDADSFPPWPVLGGSLAALVAAGVSVPVLRPERARRESAVKRLSRRARPRPFARARSADRAARRA